MDCEALKKKIAVETDPVKKAQLQAEYDAKCGAQTNSDSGDNGPPPSHPGG